MAVVERRMAQDCVGIYASDTWTQITVGNHTIFSCFLFLQSI